jgi:ribonuclease HI
MTIECFFDGSSSPNPGRMGYGWVIEVPANGSIGRLEWGEIDGTGLKGTNNQAEYRALLALLDSLRHLPLLSSLSNDRCIIRINGDSQLVIKQMKGEYSVDNPTLAELHSLAAFAVDVIIETKSREGTGGKEVGVEYNWVPRSANAIANRLSSPKSHPPSPIGQSVEEVVERWRKLLREKVRH